MNRVLRVLLLSALTLVGAQPLLAQADWTLNVPLNLTRIPSDVQQGAVICVVGPEVATSENSDQLPRGLNDVQAQFGSMPGDAIPEWPGIGVQDGNFLGFQTFNLDASGNSPSSVRVEIVAPESVAPSLRGAADTWVCTLALYFESAWSSTHPQLYNEGAEAAVTPAEGSRYTIYVTGSIPRG